MLLLFQFVFIVFACIALVGVIKRYREGLLGPKGLVFWFLFWLTVILVVIWPDSTSMIASIFGIGRGVDFIIYSAIAILFFLLFRLHIKLESIGRDVTRLTRGRSLEDKKIGK